VTPEPESMRLRVSGMTCTGWATLRTIRQNPFLAFLYNTLAIPLAAFGLLGTSGPLWAAMAVGVSDITVVGNPLQLKRRRDRM
jgi:Cu+-exporting ATPase